MCNATYKLEAAADGGLDVGAAKGGHFAQLPGDLDGVVQQQAQAALVAKARRTGNLSEQDWGTEGGDEDEHGHVGGWTALIQLLFLNKRKFNLNFRRKTKRSR